MRFTLSSSTLASKLGTLAKVINNGTAQLKGNTTITTLQNEISTATVTTEGTTIIDYVTNEGQIDTNGTNTFKTIENSNKINFVGINTVNTSFTNTANAELTANNTTTNATKNFLTLKPSFS